MSNDQDHFAANGWQYQIQREHVRGEAPHYSLWLKPPNREGLKWITDAAEVARRIVPVKLNDGTRANVKRTIKRHMKHVEKYQCLNR